MYICHIYSSCFLRSKEESLSISILCQSVVGIFGKFPNWHLYQSKILVTLAICGLQSKFQFLPHLSIKSIFSNTVCVGYLGNFAFGPHFVQQFMVSCVAKMEISTISLTVWHVGYQSHGILGNFDIFPTKSAIS